MSAALVELLTESRQRGFLGPGPVEGHIAHARVFARADRPAPARALDLGAGGGLPGLVLASLEWPETAWCLLDAQLRRIRFLEEAVSRLGLGERVTVIHARAEDYGRQEDARASYDLVVARSFGAPAVVAECAAPLLRVGGALVVSEPPDTPFADRWPTDGIGSLGFGTAEAIVRTQPEGEDVHLVHLPLERHSPERFPRRVGIPARRPLF